MEVGSVTTQSASVSRTSESVAVLFKDVTERQPRGREDGAAVGYKRRVFRLSAHPNFALMKLQPESGMSGTLPASEIESDSSGGTAVAASNIGVRPSEKLRSMGEKLGTHFQASRVVFAQVGKPDRKITVLEEWEGDGEGSGLDQLLNDELLDILAGGNPVSVSNLSTDKRFSRQRRRLSARSFVHAPFAVDNRLEFILSVQRSEPYEWRPDEVVLLRDTAERIFLRFQRDRAEAALASAVRFDEAVLGNMGEGLYTTDKDGLLVSMNPVAEKTLGWTANELRGRRMDDVIHPKHVEGKDIPIDGCEIFNVLRTGKPVVDIDDVFTRMDGTLLDVRYTSSPLIDAGEVIGLVVVFRDVSERQQIENRLRESEQRFARFMQHLPGLAWIKDSEGRYLFANEAAEKAFGVSQNELYGKTDAEVFPPDTAAAFVSHDKEALASDSGVQVIEALETAPGEVTESLVSKFTITGEKNDKPMIGGMAIDVTAQRQIQRDQEFLFAIADKIRTATEAEALLPVIARLVGQYLGVHRCLFNEIDLGSDTEVVHSDFSRSGESVAGVHRISEYSSVTSEIMMSGQTVVNRDSKKDPRTAKLFSKTYEPNQERSYVAVPMLRNGKWVASLWCSDDKPRNWSDREIELIENIAERTWSAVERLRSQEALEANSRCLGESEERFRLASEAVRGVIYDWDLTSGKVSRSVEIEKLLGFSKTEPEVETTVWWEGRVHPDDFERARRTFEDAISSGDTRFEEEYRIRHREGRFVWVNDTGRLVRDSTGRAVRCVGSVTDITERKRAEQALRESEERFQLAQSAGSVGVWDWDIVANQTYWSDTMWRFYGEIPSSSVNPDDEFWSAHLHPDDRRRVKENLERTIRSSDLRYTDEFRILGASGKTIWIESMANIVRAPDGTAVRAYGVNLDITERKLNEERIKRNETQLRLVTDSLPALIAYIDSRKRYQFVNGTYSEWFGWQPADLIGKPVREIIGQRAYETVRPYMEQALAGEAVSIHTEIHYRNIGTKFIHLNYVPDRTDDGSVRGFFSLISDLTEMKRSEELLRSSEERMALLMENVSDYAIFSTDTEGVIESWNIGAERIFGYSAEEIVGTSGEVLFTSEDVARGVHLNEMRVARQKGRATDERWHVRKDGARFFATGVMMPLIVGKRLTGYAKIAGDLTEKKRRAEALQTAHDEMELRVFQRTKELGEMNELLRREVEQRKVSEKHRVKLLHRIVSAQEAERKRIARDIHDQLGQRLTALRLKLASLHNICTDNEVIASRVERLQEIATLLDSEVSFLASELRPSILDDLGLEEAIRAYTREWSNHFDIEVRFHSNGPVGKRYGREAETQVYRIAQEALNNIAKHAGPSEVTVLMEQTSDFLVLIVEDTGSGFEMDGKVITYDSGLGLVGMRERATLIGAALEIESKSGQGTTIFLRLPIRKRGQTNGR